MVARSRIGTAALAVVAAAAAVVVACGSLIGIEDGTLDPDLSGADASIDSPPPMKDSSTPTDSSMTPDAAPAPPGPLSKPGGDTASLPCNATSCSIPAQTCCAYRAIDGGAFTAACATSCAPIGSGQDRLSALKCSGLSNCGSSARCCYTRTGQDTIESSCRPVCNTLAGETELCELASSSCLPGFVCTKFGGSTLPATYGYCL
jgi:hypothetical protein